MCAEAAADAARQWGALYERRRRHRRISVCAPARAAGADRACRPACRPRRSWRPAGSAPRSLRGLAATLNALKARKPVPRGADPSPAGERRPGGTSGCSTPPMLLRVIAAHGADLVLHGHDHLHMLNWLTGPNGTRVPAVGVPSASAAPGTSKDAAAYNLYAHRRRARRLALRADLARHRRPPARWSSRSGHAVRTFRLRDADVEQRQREQRGDAERSTPIDERAERAPAPARRCSMLARTLSATLPCAERRHRRASARSRSTSRRAT